MRHMNPNADPAAIIERALTLLVDQLEKTKTAKTSRPRGSSPRTEKSRTENPRIESPRIESPRIESPRIESPRIESPRIESPRIEKLRTQKHRIEKPRMSRNIPASVRRLVWTRDQGRCAFVGARGRCTETGRLEFHHVVPFARGGPPTAENISLRCRAHNNFESEQLFGPWPRQAREISTRSGPS